ncbi:ubiquitin carboxyl-terminal hydrolase 32-like [Gigantopelta aegis]|uniref:ubiquitin carboxyl-terminal hydrolase 32-like n=1 Tax=Gigantopelta aegis TaxID=1735272 RepID=UPI001B88CD96|nr:ubiquitin carboxyl-terminal hydrolase 32-like [Gigantopelta aegis]
MGGKDSKLAFISYEDAVKRVSENECKRLKEAFKRASTLNGLMTESLFIREVLWDGVPPKLAQLIYQGCGGSNKGLSFKDLVCGLVVLTKGTREEKIKLIFGMYADESYSYVQKDEMDRRVLETEGQVSPALSTLFRESDQVNFETFYQWVRIHPDATIITRWLLMEQSAISLSNDMETPTFYQTLAGVTHLEETDIIELEKRYWILKAQSKSGRFDQETFKSFVTPPLPDVLTEGLFLAFDENRDNHIDFKEMACGISACCRGPSTERQKFCFKVFDKDHDGKLNSKDITEMMEALNVVLDECKSLAAVEIENMPKLDPEVVTQEILSSLDTDKDGCITMEEYLVWTVKNTLTDDFLNLLTQICHVVLGLKPQTREEEGRIIQCWLERESRKPLQVGQVWYLISMQWWNTWLEYVNGDMFDIQSPQNVSKQKLVKTKGTNGALAWEDESVIMVNHHRMNGGGDRGDREPPHQNHHPPFIHSGSPYNSLQRRSRSPRKNSLNPLENVVASNRSPSPSPTMKRKHMIGPPQKPVAIDNNSLVMSNTYKVTTLTNEGGRLKRDVMLVRGKDFELVPEPVWRALSSWYGGAPALPRTVIMSSVGDPHPELELYPVTVRLLRHQLPSQRPPPPTTFTGMMAGIGGMAMSFAASPTIPRRNLAYVAAFSRKHTLQQIYDFLCTKLRFSREDIHLWKISPKDEQNLTLLDDECVTVEDAGIEEGQQILIEVRNKDLTWPEEMSQLAKNKTMKKDDVPTERGATGLNNLGNTCFMNAALQCVSNSTPLTEYFNGGLHLFELNRTNPLGMKGHIAQRYGELVKELWSGTTKTTAPLKFRWTIGKYAPRFNGFQQHDSQELLSFLLDGLHEDLNRVHDKPYVELKDSDMRPDEEVAREAWDNHLLRNQSVIVDLFHGQLKSKVKCQECGHVSVRFDPFTYLSLPLPMDSCIHLEVIVNRLAGSVPTKYGLRLSMDEKYRALKKELSLLSGIPADDLLFVEVLGPIVKTLPQDNQKIRTLLGGTLYAYELPPTPEIKSLSAEEEHSSRVSKESIGLSEIQRGLTSKRSQMCSPANGSIPNGVPPQLEVSPAETDSPSHSRSPSNPGTIADTLSKSVDNNLFNGFVIGVHRKMVLMDVYFLSSQKTRPSLFGTPIIIPCQETTTNQELYQFVWLQVSRLVSPLPPSESKAANHAQDCDDSLGYEYPFTLKAVQKDGFTCASCPWYRFCRGCKVECSTDLFNFGGSFLAIDWEPTALHLRYQTTQERFFEEHPSVEESRRKQTEPIDLDTCLQAFTKEEDLDEDDLYFCSKCKKHCLANKKLDIWRLPPILIINLKRFQFLNGRWVKSHKIVKFPIKDFDPTHYLAPRSSPKETTDVCGEPGQDLCSENESSLKHNESDGVSEANENTNSSKPTCPVQTQDDTDDYSAGRYNLVSMSCHTGILGGGHYVAYAKNPNGKWYCYNDSSCKEIPELQLDTKSAYILFYERENIDLNKIMPDVTGKEPDMTEIDDEFESDFKKNCVLQ